MIPYRVVIYCLTMLRSRRLAIQLAWKHRLCGAACVAARLIILPRAAPGSKVAYVCNCELGPFFD